MEKYKPVCEKCNELMLSKVISSRECNVWKRVTLQDEEETDLISKRILVPMVGAIIRWMLGACGTIFIVIKRSCNLVD